MLTRDVDGYLALRRALGFDLKSDGSLLYDFARFASSCGDMHVRTHTATEWAAKAPSPPQRERRLQVVVRFARHARAEDPRHEVPPIHVFGHRRQRRLPHIYAPEEIRRLLDAASRLGSPTTLRPHVFTTLFGLLAATGMRVSEALALRLGDVTPDGLIVRKTKFKKSRLVPLHETAVAALGRYLDLRRRAGGISDHVFITSKGGRLRHSTVNKTFLQIARSIGLRSAGSAGPRLHDLRHTVAVRALETSPQGARSVGRHMCALSTYLGHVRIADTYWYLQATPRLMRRIADACEALLEGGAQ